MPTVNVQQPDMPREIRRSIADHEVFLSFNGDDDAQLFYEWWNERGWEEFELWANQEKNKP
ncbi:MAG: hypothetical protein IT428_31435 [Planctomycetaceae bacterium]|nr:hypothetical protein [Planctomycetaceae bacterium]